MSSRKRSNDQEPSTESETAVAEPPSAEVSTVEQTFVDRVGPKKGNLPPDPFGIASDNIAGVQLFESKRQRQMAIKFGEGRPEDKPSQAIIDKMKDAGFRWSSEDRVWTKPVRFESSMTTRIDAERLYQDVRQAIRQEKGIESSKEVPF